MVQSAEPPGGPDASRSERSAHQARNAHAADERILRAESVEERLHLSADDLAAYLAVESIKGFGPQKFRELYETGLTPAEIVASPTLLQLKGSRTEGFQRALEGIVRDGMQTYRERAVRQLVRAYEHKSHILTYASPDYPRNVWRSNNPVPILYVKGDPRLVAESRTVACVGSRTTSGKYAERHEEFASFAASLGFTVVSGFALGADTIGHKAAWRAGGETICVMPCGLDRPFPPENRQLWHDLTAYPGAAMISEFPFGTAASSLTLRKRNKLIVAASLGVLVSQSSERGGAMNAYRFALEQRKPTATFKEDGTESTSGNKVIRLGRALAAGKQLRLDDIPGRAFPADRADKDAWAEWLRRLSSSI
jgi:DNA processing protein